MRHPAEPGGENWQLQGMSSIRPTAAPCASRGQPAGEPGLPDRLLYPRWMGQRIGWGGGPGHPGGTPCRHHGRVRAWAIGIYLSGQLTTEDYYVANKLMKGYLWQCQCGHQLPALHVVGRGGPPARLRGGSGARLLRGSGARRSGGAHRCQHRLDPSRAVSPPAAGQGAAPELRLVVLDPRRTMTAEQGGSAPGTQARQRRDALERPVPLSPSTATAGTRPMWRST